MSSTKFKSRDLIREKIENSRRGGCGVSRSAVVRQLQCLNCSELKPEDCHVEVPTFVISGEHDALIPSSYAKEMASEIPGSEY